MRTAAAKYVGGQFDDMVMTDSTTMGLGVLYGGLVLREGQEILTSTHDHIVTHLSLENRAKRTNTPVKRISLYANAATASVDEITGNLAKAITPATRVIALTWVHSGTGVKLPIKELSAVIAKANANRAEADRAIFFVDGVHGFGNQAERVNELSCDFFAAGCHKCRARGASRARRSCRSMHRGARRHSTSCRPRRGWKRLAAKRIVASVTPSFYDPLYARLAPSLLTLEADVDASIAAVAEIAV